MKNHRVQAASLQPASPRSRRAFLDQTTRLAGAAAMLGSSPLWAQAAQTTPLPALGTRLAVPEITLFDGQVFRPAQADGQVLVLYWWSSDCPFCALQSPDMQKLWDSQHARGLQMLALSIDRRPEDATAYLRKKGYTFPAGFVTPALERSLPRPSGRPVTVVRGRDGRVVLAERGQLFPEDVERIAQWL